MYAHIVAIARQELKLTILDILVRDRNNIIHDQVRTQNRTQEEPGTDPPRIIEYNWTIDFRLNDKQNMNFEMFCGIMNGYSRKWSPLTLPSEQEENDRYTLLIQFIYFVLKFISNSLKLHDWAERTAESKLYELLIKTLNNEGHTPLTLASTVKNQHLFAEILTNSSVHRYTYGPLAVKLFDLDGFELPVDLSKYSIPKDKKLPKVKSAIEWLCISNARLEIDSDKFASAIAAFSNPVVKGLIENKWNKVTY
jgi:hypothetical protein